VAAYPPDREVVSRPVEVVGYRRDRVAGFQPGRVEDSLRVRVVVCRLVLEEVCLLDPLRTTATFRLEKFIYST
jgi:hypothetical protein